MNEKKNLFSLKFYSVGGLYNKKDLHNLKLQFYNAIIEKTCSCEVSINNITIEKTFSSNTHPIIKQIFTKLNNYNLDNIETELQAFTDDDASYYVIEYTYLDNEEKREIKAPNNKELIILLRSFITDYLLKDEELLSIFNALMEKNKDVSYPVLQQITNNKKVFNQDDCFQLNNLKSSDDSIENLDDIIKQIDERIKDAEQ